MTDRHVTVALPDRPYDVVVGRGLLGRLGDVLGDVVASAGHRRRAVVVTQAAVAQHHLGALDDFLARVAQDHDVVEVPDGEPAKSVEVLASLWTRCAGLPLGRGDLVVALGGGVVGDLAGFLAATWNRGVDVVQVPTTLLAQVDAAIGGKTGINLAEGKNLVGAFHQPLAVACDVDTLATLGTRERVSGLGEVVKYALIDDRPMTADGVPDGPTLLERLETEGVAEAARDGDLDLLGELVAHSAAVKAAVVAGDEREGGGRAFLNLGHTYGHAVETLGDYRTHLHGEAVAIGIAAALRIGVAVGRTPEGLVARYETLGRRLGLPVAGPSLDRDDVWRVVARDKKADGGGVRFVLLDGVGRPALVRAERAAVDTALDAVAVA